MNVICLNKFAQTVITSKLEVKRGENVTVTTQGILLLVSVLIEGVQRTANKYIQSRCVWWNYNRTQNNNCEYCETLAANFGSYPHIHWVRTFNYGADCSQDVIREHAPAFSIGGNYHSCCHADLDMHYTLTTMVAPENHDVDNIIYFFVFPSYYIKISLRFGDTLLFNPSIPHSCRNPKIEGNHIMPAHVAQKLCWEVILCNVI